MHSLELLMMKPDKPQVFLIKIKPILKINEQKTNAQLYDTVPLNINTYGKII